MASSEQLFGEESSSSDSSEESSSEEEQQLLQQQNGGKAERSSSSGSEEESGSGSEQEEPRAPSVEPISEDEGPPEGSKELSATAQELFGGESSSESSSESESNAEGSVGDAASRSRSSTPKSGGSTPASPKSPGDEAISKNREGGAKGKSSQTLEGIFGDASDLSSSDDEGVQRTSRRVHEEVDFANLSDEPEPAGPGETEERVEEEEMEEEEEAPRINVDIPRCVAHLGTDLHFVKLPNFLSVETRPFDSELYEDEGEDDDVLDEEGRARLKLKVENTIRWRYVHDEAGNEVRESNARVVRWTDGSMSLYLGSEIFDISKQPLQGEYSHLFVRQGTGLQGQAVFKNKVTFRPHSTDSQTHRKMTLSIADRFSKAQKIRVLPAVGKDPESQRNERIKKAEESLRLAVRQGQKRKHKEYTSSRKYGITASYLEPDREVDLEEDISAIKSAVRSRMGAKRGTTEMSDASSEEEEEELEDRLTKAKDMRGESPPAKRQTRRSRGGGPDRGGRKGVRSRKIISSSEEESD